MPHVLSSLRPLGHCGISFFFPKQKSGGSSRLRRHPLSSDSFSGWLRHVRRLRPLGPLHNLEFDRISFLQCPVTVSDNRGIMYEHIRPILAPDESVSFRIIEPLYCSLHFVSPLAGDYFVSYSWGGFHSAPP